MIVVHIATTLGGGAGIALSRQHRALLNAGVDSRVLCLSASGGDAQVAPIPARAVSTCQRVMRRLGIAGAPQRLARRVQAETAATGATYELFSLPYSDHAPESHPWVAEADVIHLHWVAGALDWPRFFATLGSRPFAMTLHDQQPYLGGFHYAADLVANPRMRVLETDVAGIKQKALQQVRNLRVIANSEWNAREARASGFYRDDVEIETILYPLDTHVYRPRPKPDAKAAFGLSPTARVVGFACDSLANPRKGFADLLAALESLSPAARDELVLLSFGRAPSEELRRRVKLPWVHLGFLDADAAKAAAYSAMDVFVAPSRAEAFGQTAIEALACETCVIASDAGGLREAVDQGRAGVLFPAGDSAALARALGSLLDDGERRRTLAAAGRELVVRRHAPERIAGATLATYQTLLARRS